jgi:hypothetical protein
VIVRPARGVPLTIGVAVFTGALCTAGDVAL